MILIFDFETTGLEIPNDVNGFITEFGYMLCDVKLNIIESGSYLIKTKIENEKITQLTGITNEMLENYGIECEAFKKHFTCLIGKCTQIVAHNGHNFDFKIAEKICEINSNIQRIDTMTDLKEEIYQKSKSRSLCCVARIKEFNCELEGHRAINDVVMVYHICKISQECRLHNLNTKKTHIIIKLDFKSPRFQLNKTIVKENNFTWNHEQKIWEKFTTDEKEVEKLKIIFEDEVKKNFVDIC